LDMCEEVFKNQIKKKYLLNSYGGESYIRAIGVLKKVIDSSEKDLGIWINYLLRMEHNTGSFMNNENVTLVLNIGNHKYSGYWGLMKYCSSGMKRFGGYLLKRSTGESGDSYMESIIDSESYKESVKNRSLQLVINDGDIIGGELSFHGTKFEIVRYLNINTKSGIIDLSGCGLHTINKIKFVDDSKSLV